VLRTVILACTDT